MKTFLDLLATELHLDVNVNGNATYVNLLAHLSFSADDHVTIDGIEILPKYLYLAENRVLEIPEPFYRWYHRISGQGWLLTPQ